MAVPLMPYAWKIHGGRWQDAEKTKEAVQTSRLSEADGAGLL